MVQKGVGLFRRERERERRAEVRLEFVAQQALRFANAAAGLNPVVVVVHVAAVVALVVYLRSRLTSLFLLFFLLSALPFRSWERLTSIQPSGKWDRRNVMHRSGVQLLAQRVRKTG